MSFTESCLHPNIQRLKPTIPPKDMYYTCTYIVICIYIYIQLSTNFLYIYMYILHRFHFSRYGPSYLIGLHQVQAKVVEAQLHPIHSSCLGHPRIFLDRGRNDRGSRFQSSSGEQMLRRISCHSRGFPPSKKIPQILDTIRIRI